MKQLFAYSLLFCLVFLNVPRSIVHDCAHEHEVEHHHDHDSDHSSEDHDFASLDDENESCFICEFDLDVFETPNFHSKPFAKFINAQIIEPSFDCSNQIEFSAYSLRGPPSA